MHTIVQFESNPVVYHLVVELLWTSVCGNIIILVVWCCPRERERERERESNLKSRILSFCHTPACIFGYQRIFFIIIWMCSHRYFSYWNIFFREILSNNRSLVLYICFVDCCLFLCTISLGHCVVCSSSMYGFWLPLWYLLAIALSVLLRCTDSDCPLGIFKLFLLNIH